MTQVSDTEWEKQAEEMMNDITNLIDGEESDMIIEVFACIIADMLDSYPVDDAVPMLLKFMSEILKKAYGVEAGFTKVGNMQ
jgi:hypothetical protein